MKYYTSTTEFNCGIDLHARQMYVCVMDRQGKKLVHTNIKNNDFEFFLKLVAPYRHDLTVCAECMFGWYWLADACQKAGLTFVLAHALYLKAIHGGKNKNDRVDSEKIAHLLRSNLIPPSYVYPADKRPLRALLRQRLFYVWRRSELVARIQSHQLAQNRAPVTQTRRNRDPWEERLLAAETDPLRRLALQNDMAMIRHFDRQISALEEELQRQAKKSSPREYALLQTTPGIGENLGMTILCEIGDIQRFPTVKNFLSYCRLVKGTVASAGKIKGLRGAKLGNPYLRWAFGEAAVIAKRDHAVIGPLAQRLEARLQGNKFKANTVLAIKLARAVYFMLRSKSVFDPDRLVMALSRNIFRPCRAPTRTPNWIRSQPEAPVSHRLNSLVPEHPRSALGAGGIRCFDWERSSVVLHARHATAGGASSGLAARPRLVYLTVDIPREMEFWRIRPTRTSAKNWSPKFRKGPPGSRLRIEWIVGGCTESVSGPGCGVGSRPWQAG